MALLNLYAAEYALEERVAEVLTPEKPLDTSALDARLAFQDQEGHFDMTLWEQIAKLVPTLKLYTGVGKAESVYKKIGIDRTGELFETGNVDSDEVSNLREMVRLCQREPLRRKPPLTDETQRQEDLCILRLRRIGTTLRWQEMTEKERQHVVQRLFDAQGPSNITQILKSFGIEDVGI